MSKIKLIAPKQRCGTNMILGDMPEFHIPEDGAIEIDSSKLKVFLKLGFVTPTVDTKPPIVDDDEKSEEDKDDDDAKSPTVDDEKSDDEDKKPTPKKSESKKIKQ